MAEPLATHPQDPDGDIIRCHWLTLAEIEALGDRLRSPLILASCRITSKANGFRCRR
ncbi:hypothetical protein MBH78_15205 [Oceanimonas sp. NS1]|nr:hypothetical protein [Oceanimonas sp. NS1]